MILGLCITTVQLSGISSTTTQPAPIFTLFPIFTFPIIFAPAPIKTLSPIIGPFPPNYIVRANGYMLHNRAILTYRGKHRKEATFRRMRKIYITSKFCLQWQICTMPNFVHFIPRVKYFRFLGIFAYYIIIAKHTKC